MTMPTFLVIGPPKCGTTSLYMYLQQHPDVYMSPVKEPHFFAFEGKKVAFRGPGAPMNDMVVGALADYRQLFAGAAGQTAVGEASTFYLYYPETARAIHRHLPAAKLIAMLRNPVERAFSAYMHKRRDGREPLTDFMAALEAEEERLARNWAPLYHYRHTGYYAAQLKRYLEVFPAEQLRIYLYDDFQADPARVIADLFGFVGVDQAVAIDTSERHNVSGMHRNPAARGLFLLQRNRSMLRLARRSLPKRLRRGLKERVILPWHRRSLVKRRLPDDARAFLTDAYRADVHELEQLLQRDLSPWLEPAP